MLSSRTSQRNIGRCVVKGFRGCWETQPSPSRYATIQVRYKQCSKLRCVTHVFWLRYTLYLVCQREAALYGRSRALRRTSEHRACLFLSWLKPSSPIYEGAYQAIHNPFPCSESLSLTAFVSGPYDHTTLYRGINLGEPCIQKHGRFEESNTSTRWSVNPRYGSSKPTHTPLAFEGRKPAEKEKEKRKPARW